MRSAIVLAVVIAATPAAAAPRYISIGADALPAARDLDPRVQLVEQAGEVDILAIDEEDLDALSVRMHEQFDRCGGFLVHDSLADAEAVAPARPGPGYTIDRDAVVRPVIETLDKDRILATIRELSAMPTRRY